MTEHLQNPRRSPRAPARCRTTVVSAGGAFEATTEDVGGHGCQLVSPRLVRKGEPVQLVVFHEAMKDSLRVAGRIAWASDRAPWRLGIAYDESALGHSQKWFDQLLSRVPGLSAFRRIPDRIAVDAVVYLATPPRFLVDFTADEVAVLRSVGSGTSVAELRALLRDRWSHVQRALFSLLAHQHVTLSRGASVHPDAWRKILSEAESSLAVESLRGAPVPDLTPPPTAIAGAAPPPAPGSSSWRLAPAAATRAPSRPAPIPSAPPPPPAPEPVEAIAVPEPTSPEADAPSDWLVSAADMMPTAWPAPGAPGVPGGGGGGLDPAFVPGAAPPPLTGGFDPRPAAAVRTAEAQGCYDRALAELGAGRMAPAMALLRRALALAPGDPEIAATLVRAMSGGR